MEPRWGGKHIKYDTYGEAQVLRVHYLVVVLHLMYCCEDLG